MATFIIRIFVGGGDHYDAIGTMLKKGLQVWGKRIWYKHHRNPENRGEIT